MGVVAWPSAVTGFAAISIMAEMTFMPGRQGRLKVSQTAGASEAGLALDFGSVTVFSAMMFWFLEKGAARIADRVGLRGPFLCRLPGKEAVSTAGLETGATNYFAAVRCAGGGLMNCVSTASYSNFGPSSAPV